MPLLQIGDRLTLGNKFRGTVKYIGRVKSREGRWIGLELDDPVGANDGSVSGVRYFHCTDKHGIFVRYEKIRGGLICENKNVDEVSERSKEEPIHQRYLYESKIRRLEETIDLLKNAEKHEILELRKENNSIKGIILELQEKLERRDEVSKAGGRNNIPTKDIACSEVKELLGSSKKQISEMMGLVSDMEKCIQKKAILKSSAIDMQEKSRVLFLVSQIIDGVLDDDIEKIEYFVGEFKSIMEKYGIPVE